MNLKISKIENLISVIFILLSITFYFLGFFYREISNGAGHTDLQLHIWPLVNDFNENYVYTLKNYLSYKEATFPFFHTLQAFLNPFKKSYFIYCLSNTIFNLLILYIFFIYIKKKKIFSEKNLDLLLLVVFIFLLSPWFRSSSYWGMTENLSIFFLIPSIYYLSKVFEKKDNIKINIILAIFISLTIYARQQYLFLGLTHVVILLFERDNKKIIYTFLIYFIFSLPGIFVYNLWGVFQNLENATSASSYISIKNIYINFPKISCLIFFYLLPLIITNLGDIITIFGISLTGFSFAPIFPSMVSETSIRVGMKHHANTIGLQMSSAGLGMALIPSIAGVLAKYYGLEIIPIFLIVIFIFMLLIYSYLNFKY